MKNQKEKQLLSCLAKECKPNQFSVIEKKDILSSFPKSSQIDEEELDEIMLSLERQAHIKIKYEDDNVYCLCLIKDDIEKREASPSFKNIFWFGLLGGFCGSLIGSFIAFLFLNL